MTARGKRSQTEAVIIQPPSAATADELCPYWHCLISFTTSSFTAADRTACRERCYPLRIAGSYLGREGLSVIYIHNRHLHWGEEVITDCWVNLPSASMPITHLIQNVLMFLIVFFPPFLTLLCSRSKKSFMESLIQNSDKVSTWDLQDLHSFVNLKWAVANCALYFAF